MNRRIGLVSKIFIVFIIFEFVSGLAGMEGTTSISQLFSSQSYIGFFFVIFLMSILFRKQREQKPSVVKQKHEEVDIVQSEYDLDDEFAIDPKDYE